MIARRCLQVAFLEGLTVPGAIAFVHVHVVHVDGYPDVSCGISDFVIDVFVDEEVVGARLAILDIIDARLVDAGEVELHIVVFVEGSPRSDIARVGLLCLTVGTDAHECGGGLWRVGLVEFDDCHLRLFGDVAHLRESDVRLTNPARDGMWFDGPCDYLARLACRQDAAKHKPAVLR